MNKANSSLETLVNEGLIGVDFAAILAEDKEDAAIVSILESAIAATANAYEEAIKTNVAFYIEEGGKIFKIGKDGKKDFVKEIKQNTLKFHRRFKLG